MRRTADLVFLRERIAVMIDGCYWHGCPEHYVPSKSNTSYWSKKIAGNVARDADTDARLRAAGWLALRFWAHEDPEAVADAIGKAVYEQRDKIGPTSRGASG